MKPYYVDDSVTLYHGDALEVLRSLPADSIDAVVTDPPYELGFMGRAWDASGIAYNVDLWREVLRVLKPGGHLLAFGGTRTVHRLTCAIEDAGFEIRDSIMWHYGSGFPKSLDVSKAIDKAAGAERELTRPGRVEYGGLGEDWAVGPHSSQRPRCDNPATDDAARWSGWGTALKPATEPIVVARKPLQGTVAANVQAHGTGALNIDATRVGLPEDKRAAGTRTYQRFDPGSPGKALQPAPHDGLGRWPSNVVLSHALDCQPVGKRKVRGNNQRATDDAGQWTGSALAGSADGSLNAIRSSGYADADGYETVPAWACVEGCPVAELDQQSGTLTSGGGIKAPKGKTHGFADGRTSTRHDWDRSYEPSTGSASRFFPVFRYEPKADSAERPRVNGVAHPTVKPLQLMRWLVRLVCPPGGVVLDPFAGSGTTGEACTVEGFRCVLVEREADYLPLIVARLSKPLQPVLFGEEVP